MPTIVVPLPAWNFSIADETFGAIYREQIGSASLRVLVDAPDCDEAALNVKSLNLPVLPPFALEPAGTTKMTRQVPQGPLPGQSYATQARVDVTNVRRVVVVQWGLYWADCSPKKTGRGVPRFAVRAHWRVTYQAAISVFRQTFNLTGTWSAPVKDDSLCIAPKGVVREPPTSILTGDATHIGRCKKCVDLPAGSPRGRWIWTEAIVHPKAA